jgi:hypothetical protein
MDNSDARDAGGGHYEIKTIDGNSGPLGFSPLFDMSHGRKIGYGFIYQPPDRRQLTSDCYSSYARAIERPAYVLTRRLRQNA